MSDSPPISGLTHASSRRQTGAWWYPVALLPEREKAMSKIKQGRAAHGAANDIWSGPIREAAILVLRPISRREDWRTWPGRIPGKASVLVRLAETCDFKLGGREGFLGAA
jgi:hypothetical protein